MQLPKWNLQTKVLCGLLVLGLAFVVYRDRRRPDIGPVAPVHVNDSTQVLEAQLTMARSDLKALKDAARKVGGDVVAGVRIVIRAETVYVDRVVRETITLSDGTRTATVRDTTVDGVQVSIDASAPPSPAPLAIGYRIIVPQLTPEVGFIKKGESYYATVSLAGKVFTPEQAFFKVPTERRIHLLTGAQAMTENQQVRAFAFAGATLRLNGRTTLLGAYTTGSQVMVQGTYRIF